MFVRRYNKKLDLIPDADGITIDIVDAFSRLNFVRDIKSKRSGDVNYFISVLLITNEESLSGSELNEIFHMTEYISYENNRYKIDYNSILEEGKPRYHQVQIELASWNDKFYFTVCLDFRCSTLDSLSSIAEIKKLH
jgi:hypothetical protein